MIYMSSTPRKISGKSFPGDCTKERYVIGTGTDQAINGK